MELARAGEYRMPAGRLNALRKLHSAAVFGGIARFGSERMDANRKPTIIFAPHQDDETFGCGGLIALKRDCGAPLKVVFITDGSGSHGTVGAPERERLRAVRQAEAHRAGAILGLGPDDVLFLGYPDGALNRMSRQQRDEVIGSLLPILSTFRPEEVYVPHRHDRHSDHEASYRLVMTALERAGLPVAVFQYAIWMVWWSALGWRLRRGDLSGAKVLDIKQVIGRKQAAIDAYRSQHQVLPEGFMARFLSPYEVFFSASKDG